MAGTMARHRFYEVLEGAFLFPEKVKESDEQKNPEEAVRQWCAYELIRAYGINITDIEFEHPVKVGSKTYRTDILVTHHGRPIAIVECKKQGFKKHDEAMAQAISYADSQGLHAEFAVYTNGEEWHVKRRVRQEWVAIPDLPRHVDAQGSEPITELLCAMAKVDPLLYQLGQTLTGQDAKDFLSALQKLFYGNNLLTEDIDKDLRFAMDNLLRCLWAGGDDHYQDGKFRTARASFEAFRKRANIGYELYADGESLWVEMRQLHAGLMQIVDGTQGVAVGNLLVLRLAAALTHYGQRLRDVKKPKAYPPLGQDIHDPLRDYLGYALTVHLNVSLPDPLDKIWSGDVRHYCEAGWRAHLEEERT